MLPFLTHTFAIIIALLQDFKEPYCIAMMALIFFLSEAPSRFLFLKQKTFRVLINHHEVILYPN